jgi:hypothetical protein
MNYMNAIANKIAAAAQMSAQANKPVALRGLDFEAVSDVLARFPGASSALVGSTMRVTGTLRGQTFRIVFR